MCEVGGSDRMSDNLQDNPFMLFFSEVEDIDRFLPLVQQHTRNLIAAAQRRNESLNIGDSLTEEMSSPEDLKRKINCLAEEIFLFTLCENPLSFQNGRLPHLLHLKELAPVYPTEMIDMENLEQILFERLLTENLSSFIITNKKSELLYKDDYLDEKECLTYLYHCYLKGTDMKKGSGTQDVLSFFQPMTDLIIRNAATALKQPELYEETQELNKQIVKLLESGSQRQFVSFFTLVAEEIQRDEPPGALVRALTPTFDLIHRDLAQANILTFPRNHFALLKTFALIPDIAKALLTHSTPKDSKLGIAFANTLLGSAFSLSCLPKTPDGLYEYFDKPYSSTFTSLENNLWTSMTALTEELHSIFLALLKSARKQTLFWIGSCLDANIHRGRLSAMAGYMPAVFACVSDGFALNLSSVILRLAQPIIAGIDNPKVLRIDPTYTNVKYEDEIEGHTKGVHMKSYLSETCLLPVDDNLPRPCAKTFTFVSECFYMAHRSLDIGLRVVLEHMQSVYKEFVRLQNSMRDANAQGRSDVTDAIMEQMEMTTSRYFSMRCALLEPTTLNLIGELIGATSIWLVQIVLDSNAETRDSYAPSIKRTLEFPLPDCIPKTLTCVPEMFLENTASYLILLKRFSPNTLELNSFATLGNTMNGLPPVLTMLVTFMNSNKRARNPHLRARLAECLECLLPVDAETNTLGTFYREALFKQHQHRHEIVRCLLDVFVGIEMTGESVSFEQKFNYRRPMYAVMIYLWNIPEHRDRFKQLANEAEENMEAVTPPLFLRFLNLLMNDAIFLLDEALTNMAQLRTMQTARENGEWDELPENERERNSVHFQQIGMTARIDNILGQETIHALEYLSSEIKSIFCHPTMSDRVAAMLNYFLVHLVGPKMKNFKVKDQKEFKFDPADIVLNICKMYNHLAESDEFCAAVSRDGRSYNPMLFKQAHDVLVRIGGSSLIGDLLVTSERVQKFANLQKAEEEVLADVPDEFLDPIMSTLMSDPVILPSSHITLDRSTIARHLLSDQSDPFNRSLLTMDMVTSNTELKERISRWLKEKRSYHNLGATSSDTVSQDTDNGN